MRRDERATSELVAAALAELPYGDEDSFLRSNAAIVALQERGSRDVFEAACRLCGSADPSHRLIGSEILGELGNPDRNFQDECSDRLVRLLWEDPVPDVVESALFSLGQLGSRRADPDIASFHTHQLAGIRHGVAFALVGATDTASIDVLLRLMRDPDIRTRDWATTAIGGFVEIDGEHIRTALFEAISDEYPGVQGEAHAGLARRRDLRAIGFLVEELELRSRADGGDQFASYFEDAAKIFLGIEEDCEVDAACLAEALKNGALRP